MGRIPREGRPALAVLCTAQFLLVLDITAVFVALPAIGADLGLSPGARGCRGERLRAHARPGAAAAGRLADARGRRRTFVAGMALFGVASLALRARPVRVPS